MDAWGPGGSYKDRNVSGLKDLMWLNPYSQNTRWN